MVFIILILIFILGIIFCTWKYFLKKKITPNTSKQILSEIDNTFQIMIHNMKKKYLIDGQGTEYEEQITKRLLTKYNSSILSENFPTSKINTSYVLNKGDAMKLCLRPNNDSNEFHKLSHIKFVALHELSHIATVEYGHPKQFWKNFKFLIQEAIDANVYTPINYIDMPILYCGVEITHNPYYDNNV